MYKRRSAQQTAPGRANTSATTLRSERTRRALARELTIVAPGGSKPAVGGGDEVGEAGQGECEVAVGS